MHGTDIPRDRNGEFKTSVIPRRKQYEEEITRDFSILFLAGVSTRTLSMISERLIGRRISAAEISSVNTELNTAVEAWRRRDLSHESVKYLFIDGVHFHMRVGRSIERLNKEFRRRTKVMEIVAGEIACYRILAYISLKMEMHWRSNPVGKVRKNLPFFKEFAYEYLTQKT